MPLEVGQSFAGYEIVGTLGVGGMGEVYLGKHPRLPRRDALKILRGTVTGDDEYRQRFIREADIVAGLSHPNIVSVHDRGDFDGRLWIAMDYIEGMDAGYLLTSRYPDGMPPEDVARIVRAIARRSTMPTNATCCTGTSNPPTFCSPTPTQKMRESTWATSVLPDGRMTRAS